MSRSAWYGVRESVDGDGVITYFGNGQAARLNSQLTTSGNRATLYWQGLAIPGSTISFSFSARATQNSGGADAPFIAVDYPETGTIVREQKLSSIWQSYEMNFTVPYDSDPDNLASVTLGLGVFTAQSGEIEVTRPLVRTLNEPFNLSSVMRESQNTAEGTWTALPGGELIQTVFVLENRSESGLLTTEFDWPREFYPVAYPNSGNRPAGVSLNVLTPRPDLVTAAVSDITVSGGTIVADRSSATNNRFCVTAFGRWKPFNID